MEEQTKTQEEIKQLDKKEKEKYYNKRLNKLFKKIAKTPFKTTENFKKITELLGEMEKHKVITQAQHEKHINRIYNNLNSPQEFKEWINKKQNWLINKIRRKQKKTKV